MDSIPSKWHPTFTITKVCPMYFKRTVWYVHGKYTCVVYANCSAGSLILQGLTDNIQERFYSYKGHMKESKEEVVWYNYMFLLLCVVCSYLCQCMWVSFPQRRIFCSACAKRRNTYFVKHQSRRHSFHSSKFLLYSCYISKCIVTES